ncbi:hypothetical protein V7795_21435 [Rhizobium laguerreae]|uniref:hypothetical protein n=1 Tax=Rhizobium laguerreae TaxID=1076926 RepID=UPI002FFD9F46
MMAEETNHVLVMADRVINAAMWLADDKDHPKPVIPAIIARFDLNAREACEACRLAQDFRRAGRPPV